MLVNSWRFSSGLVRNFDAYLKIAEGVGEMIIFSENELNELPARSMLRLRCSINCLNSSPDALRGTLGRRKGAEVSPESVAWHPWAAERGGSAAGECRAVTELAEVAIFAGMVAVILRQMMANLPNCHIRGNGITFDNTPCVRLRER